MTLWISTDHWLAESGGRLLPTHASMGTPALRKYLDSGLPVCLLARTRCDVDPTSGDLDDPRLTVRALGRDNKGRRLGWRCVLLAWWLWRVPLRRQDVVVVRLPELVGTLLALIARVRGAIVVANVVAEPRAVSGRFGIASPVVDVVLRRILSSILASSAGTVYVTRQWLQGELPPPAGRPTMTASNVSVRPGDVVPAPRNFRVRPLMLPLTLVAVGDHNSLSKGHDVLLRACRVLNDAGVPIVLHLLGDGVEHQGLRDLAAREGISGITTFHGFVPDPAEVRRLVDTADVFVMPSRSEGLPRALVEALSRGVCCVGSRVGGIPELLPESALFDPDDVNALACCLLSLLELGDDGLNGMVTEGWMAARSVVRQAEPERVTRFLQDLTGTRPGVEDAS